MLLVRLWQDSASPGDCEAAGGRVPAQEGGGHLEVWVFQGMTNVHRDLKDQLLEDIKLQLEHFLNSKNIPVQFMRVGDFAKQEKIEGRGTAQQVRGIVEHAVKNLSNVKNFLLFFDELEIGSGNSELTSLPGLVPDDGYTKVVACLRPGEQPPTLLTTPVTLHWHLPVSFRQEKKLRSILESIFLALYGYSIISGDTKDLYEDPSPLPPATWVHLEEWNEDTIKKKILEAKAEETGSCAVINIAGYIPAFKTKGRKRIPNILSHIHNHFLIFHIYMI